MLSRKVRPKCIVYGEVGKYPVVHRVHLRMISFWINLSEGKQTKLSSIMYKLIYKLHLDGSYDSPWLMSIKSILCNSGNRRYWLDQEILSPKYSRFRPRSEKTIHSSWQFWIHCRWRKKGSCLGQIVVFLLTKTPTTQTNPEVNSNVLIHKPE